MYLELIYNGHPEQAQKMIEKHASSIEEHYQSELKNLSHVTKKEHIAGNELADTFK